MITLIHGPAELLRSEAVAELRARVAADESLAELNTAHLDGQQITVAELQNACDALPFLAERRLVIVDGLLRRLTAPSQAAKARGDPRRGSERGGAPAGSQQGAGQEAADLPGPGAGDDRVGPG